MPSTSSVSLTGNLDIDGLLTGVKWTSPNLTFSFPTLLSQYGYTVSGFEATNAAQQVAVRAILAMIDTYTGLEFTEVTETSTVHGTLRYAEESNAGTAYAYYPDPGIEGGDAWFNHIDYNAPLRGNYDYFTFLHETGHTLGLDHGQDGWRALPTDHDTLEYSVMTYRSFVGADLSGYTVAEGSYPQTLMLADIAALQYMYGADYTTNATETVYTWSTTTGEMFVNGAGQGASTANTVFLTVWDGGGYDTYYLANYTTNLSVDLRPGAWTTISAAQLADLGSDFYPGTFARGNIANAYLYGSNPASLIENATGGSGNDTIIGNQGNNTLGGGDGNDTLHGLDGNDRFIGAAGNDTIVGGAGTDFCYYQNVDYVDCTVTYSDLTQIFSIESLLTGLDSVTGVEYFAFRDGTRTAATLMAGPDLTDPTLLSTSPADNSASVASTANLVLTFSEAVFAGSGNIIIRLASGVGVELISASQVSIAGNVVTINPRADFAVGQSYYVTIDDAAFRDASGNYFAGFMNNTSFNFTTALSSITGTSGADTLNGTAGDDTINGLGGNDTLNGLGGNDTLDGGTGADRMSGGTGNDLYYVDNISDTTTEASNAGTDWVYTSVSFTLGSNIERLALTGSGAINGTGNTLNNVIVGNGAANTIAGSSGADWLYGKDGSDTLTGGIGTDYFVFDTAPGNGNIDRITDFAVVDDTIVMRVAIFTGLVAGSLNPAAFTIGAAAADASDRIIYNSSTGALYYDADGIGGAAQQQIATLSTGLGLTAADFLLIA